MLYPFDAREPMQLIQLIQNESTMFMMVYSTCMFAGSSCTRLPSQSAVHAAGQGLIACSNLSALSFLAFL